jgi:glycerol-3-phosphate dehydrogenase (NAD(P)+)
MMTQRKRKRKKVSRDQRPIAVIGAGSWGTALALLLSKKGYAVRLWGSDPEHIGPLKEERENKRYLPGMTFPDSLVPTSDLKEAVDGSPTICMVVPSHGYRAVFQNLVEYLGEDSVVISAAKGIENETLQTMSQVMTDVLQNSKIKVTIEVAVLSGPSFAREVAEEVPTAITMGCKNTVIAQELQNIFNTGYFRVYTSRDIIGLEVSAALKNIIAIAAGICDGLKFGMNARAALITRGLAEISRFGIRMGAESSTFYGLSGMGDLVLTCTGDLSRNRSVGLKLGNGQTLNQILAEMSMVAEGVKTTSSVYNLAKEKKVEMPIVEQVYQILYEDKDSRTAVNDLLKRELKPE